MPLSQGKPGGAPAGLFDAVRQGLPRTGPHGTRPRPGRAVRRSIRVTGNGPGSWLRRGTSPSACSTSPASKRSPARFRPSHATGTASRIPAAVRCTSDTTLAIPWFAGRPAPARPLSRSVGQPNHIETAY